MPRPSDSYTHSQFSIAEENADPRKSTVRCNHCRSWTGNIRSLDRKKLHLTKHSDHDRPNEDVFTPVIVLTKKPDVKKAYEDCVPEFDAFTCQDFLESFDGQAAIRNGDIGMPPKTAAQTGILGGNVANPHLSGVRRSDPNQPLRPRQSYGAPATPHRIMAPPGPPKPTPSLANHLLNRDPEAVNSATQQAFLSHAGCGTISAHALTQWLAQDAHVSRAFVSFVGRLIGKMRLPDTAITMENTTFRTFDLLISTLNNVRREMSFFDTTASKWGLHIESEIPKPATKGFIDLLSSASSPSASLLEGLVLLWATEHCYRASWHYASTFTNSNTSSSNYSLPSYMTGGHGNVSNPFGPDGSSSLSNEAHINALHQALIPNWTSPAFSKFVDACRSIVDEVANSMTTGNGREEMLRCEQTFKQALWLWKDIWPEVNGMGELDDQASAAPIQPSATPQSAGGAARPSNAQRNITNNEPIEIQDDESGERSVGPDGQDSDVAQTPYGGSRLGAVHAANQSG
ncbi:hypothetical protein MBLNU13_g03438t1 [Cladosporium sp. NU13]